MALTPQLYLYNTLKRQKEKFEPIVEGKVGMYTCGPTVYNYAHIGNFRTFIFSDILRRVLEKTGYQVRQVMNVTDVDDKTIKASRAANKSLSDFTRHYEKIFFSELGNLNIELPELTPRASEHIAEMIELISRLLASGHAYQADDGIYFKINQFGAYGQLSGIKLDNQTRERIQNDEYDKENARDFALWKFHTPEDGKMLWDAPFGQGRPGWHIECSAMSTKYLGTSFDIHTGGADLIFPHHENEIAQSEAASGQLFVKYWLHAGFVNINSEKMSKSLGNTLKLDDLVQAGIPPLAYRYWVLSAHYRTTINFSLEAGLAAKTAYHKLLDRLVKLGQESGIVDKTYQTKFGSLLAEDLNTPEALALVWQVLKDETLTPSTQRATLLDFDQVLGLGLAEAKAPEIPQDILDLSKEREVARQNQDWHRADKLRQQIESRAYSVEDSAEGPRLKPL